MRRYSKDGAARSVKSSELYAFKKKEEENKTLEGGGPPPTPLAI